RADLSLGELVERVVILGEELAGDVERHRVGPVPCDRLGEAPGDVAERFVPARARAGSGARAPDLGVARTSRLRGWRHGEMQRRALRAQPPAVGRVVRVA